MAVRFLTSDNVVLSVLGVSLAANVYFAVAAIPQRRVSVGPLTTGVSVPSLEVQAGDSLQTIQFPDKRPTLIYSFSLKCKWCSRNEPLIDSLVRQSKEKYRIVPICLDCSDKDAKTIGSVAAYIKPSADTLRGYRMGPVPMTVVVDRNGTVSGVWFGTFTGKNRDQIQHALSVELPALAATGT